MSGVSVESVSLTQVVNHGNMNKSTSDIIHAIGTTPLKVMMPQVVQMCKLYLANLATAATAEHTFSLL